MFGQHPRIIARFTIQPWTYFYDDLYDLEVPTVLPQGTLDGACLIPFLRFSFAAHKAPLAADSLSSFSSAATFLVPPKLHSYCAGVHSIFFWLSTVTQGGHCSEDCWPRRQRGLFFGLHPPSCTNAGKKQSLVVEHIFFSSTLSISHRTFFSLSVWCHPCIFLPPPLLSFPPFLFAPEGTLPYFFFFFS